jgi:hypothetical protein
VLFVIDFLGGREEDLKKLYAITDNDRSCPVERVCIPL